MRFFYEYIFKRHRKKTIVLCVLGILSSLTSIIMNYSLKYSMDLLFHTAGHYWQIALLLFLIMAVTTFLADQVGENYYAEKYRLLFIRDLRRNLLDAYLSLPFAKAVEKSGGELMNRDSLTDDIGDVYISMTYFFPYCLLESIGFIIFLGVSVSWKIDIILIVLLPFAVLFKKLTDKIRQTTGEIIEKKATSHNFFLDMLSKLDFIKANGLNISIEEKYHEKNRTILNSEIYLYKQNNTLSFMQFLLENGIKFLVPVFGTWLMLNGDITPGGLAVSTTIFSAFLVPSLFQMIGFWKEIAGSRQMIEDVMMAVNKVDADKKSNFKRENLSKDTLIKVEHINYQKRNKMIAEDISFSIPIAGCIGIGGASGEGKSTLVRLLAGLLQPDKGQIVYNSKYFTDVVYRDIAYLNSDAYFMEGSVKDNISQDVTGHREHIDYSLIKECIQQLPEGEDTILLENGANLSGGQKQIVGFARAISKADSKLIILDEPTASLDKRIQYLFEKIIKEISKEKCILVVTHRRDLLKKMTYQYQLKDGKLYQI